MNNLHLGHVSLLARSTTFGAASCCGGGCGQTTDGHQKHDIRRGGADTPPIYRRAAGRRGERGTSMGTSSDFQVKTGSGGKFVNLIYNQVPDISL